MVFHKSAPEPIQSPQNAGLIEIKNSYKKENLTSKNKNEIVAPITKNLTLPVMKQTTLQSVKERITAPVEDFAPKDTTVSNPNKAQATADQTNQGSNNFVQKQIVKAREVIQPKVISRELLKTKR